MGGCGHTPEEHEAMKAPGVWETLVFIGYQAGDPVVGYGDLELRNVPGTECTLYKPCELTEDEREQAREYARKVSLRAKARVAAALAAAAHA